MDTLVLLPSFIQFFSEAKNHSTSPGNLAILFLAFGKCSAWNLILLPFYLHAVVLLSHCFHIPYRLCTFNLDAVLNLAFALSLLCFIVMHASLVSSNTTSVEVITTMFTSFFLFPDFDNVNSLLHSDTYVSLWHFTVTCHIFVLGMCYKLCF